MELCWSGAPASVVGIPYADNALEVHQLPLAHSTSPDFAAALKNIFANEDGFGTVDVKMVRCEFSEEQVA
jgi:hypothetical protein